MKKRFFASLGDMAGFSALYRQSFALLTFAWSLFGGVALGQVPATNVLVEVVDGDLRVTCQANSNQSIVVTPGTFPGQFRFEDGNNPNSTTFFNNLPSLMVSGVVGDVILDLKSGVKTVVMETTGNIQSVAIPGDLIVESASNCSTFLFFRELDVRGKTKINLKGYTDILTFFNGIFRGPINVKTGKGADSVGFQGRAIEPNRPPMVILSDVKIDTGGGADLLYLGSIESFGKFDLQLGSENDTARLFQNEIMTVNVDGMRGLDRVEVDEESIFLELNLKSVEILSSLF